MFVMALKDWKKDVDINIAKVWLSKKDKGVISINKHDDGWSFNAFPKGQRMIKKEKLNKTRALSYARAYMRKH